MKRLKNKKGFTLAELLIVVAIIAVLVGISIPIFTTQLEKSREATDLSNVRAAYAEVMVAAIENDQDATYSMNGQIIYRGGPYIAVVNLVQKSDGWQGFKEGLQIGGVLSSDTAHWIGEPKANGTCQVKYENDEVYFIWSEGTSTPSGGTPETEVPTMNGNNNPVQSENNSNTIFDANVTEYPIYSNLSDNQYPFFTISGNIYKYNNKKYVASTNLNISDKYNYKDPENSSYAFVEIRDNAKVYYNSDLHNVYDQPALPSEVLVGDFYQDQDGNVYILQYQSNPVHIPSADSNIWVKVNTQ